MMFRHGLRVSEACALQLDQVDTESRVVHVARLKKGLSTTHPLRGDELRVIKAWLADRATLKSTGRAFFISQHRKPLNRSTAGLPSANMASWPGLNLPTHPHQLRHACGFALADQGADTRLIQDYLGHRDISTPSFTRRPIRHGLRGFGGRGRRVIYQAMASKPFFRTSDNSLRGCVVVFTSSPLAH